MIGDLQQGELHTEEDENYFISMTDMMVGVLFIFIILLMAFALNFRQQTELTEDQIKELRQAAEMARQFTDDVAQLRERVSAEIRVVSEADEVRTRLLQEIRDELRNKGLNVTIDPASGVVRLGENAINFEFGRDELTPEAARNVDILAAVLGSILPRYSAGAGGGRARLETAFIEGHTDPVGVDDNNWRLSTARAVNTFRRLTLTEPDLRLLRNENGTEVISVAGYSSTRQIPGFDNDSQRRIDLRFVMSTNSLDRLKEVIRLTDDMQGKLWELRRQLDRVSER